MKESVFKKYSGFTSAAKHAFEAAGKQGTQEAARTNTEAFDKAQGFFASPYFVNADIGGIKFRGGDKDIISFYMVEDFIENDFPIRILTIVCRDEKFHRLKQAQTEDIMIDNKPVFKGVYKVVLNYDVQLNKGCSNEAILPGSYRGLLVETEAVTKYEDSYKAEKSLEEAFKGNFKTFSMYLFQYSELVFNTRMPAITHMMNNPTLMDAFTRLFNDFNPDMKMVVSPFDHNPQLGALPPIANVPFTEVIDSFDKEFGFYRTGYFYYIYKGLFCFMNMANNHNIIVQDLNNTFTVYPIRNEYDLAGYKIVQISPISYGARIKQSDIEIKTDATLSFKPTEVYINADSTLKNIQHPLSRNAVTIKKATNIPHVEKDQGIQYETIEFRLDGFVDSKFGPFTVIIYLDTENEKREYRVIGIETFVQNADISYTRIKGFRVKEELEAVAVEEPPVEKPEDLKKQQGSAPTKPLTKEEYIKEQSAKTVGNVTGATKPKESFFKRTIIDFTNKNYTPDGKRKK